MRTTTGPAAPPRKVETSEQIIAKYLRDVADKLTSGTYVLKPTPEWMSITVMAEDSIEHIEFNLYLQQRGKS